jgi:hypothetical protein
MTTCEHCGIRLYELDDGWTSYETETQERPHTAERCRDVLRTRLERMQRGETDSMSTTSGEPEDWSKPRRYRSDDRDMHGHDNDLMVLQGGNGDWYVSVVRHGERIGPSVRLTTSGMPRGYEQASLMVSRLYRCLPKGD